MATEVVASLALCHQCANGPSDFVAEALHHAQTDTLVREILLDKGVWFLAPAREDLRGLSCDEILYQLSRRPY